MDQEAQGVPVEPGQQAGPARPSREQVRRAALKNLALCAAWGAISGVRWATGVASGVLHAGYFRETSEAAGIEFAKMATFVVFLGAVPGWTIVAALVGFILLTGKWPRTCDQFPPYLPSEQPDPRLVRRAAAKNLLFCGSWSLGTSDFADEVWLPHRDSEGSG